MLTEMRNTIEGSYAKILTLMSLSMSIDGGFQYLVPKAMKDYFLK